MLAPQPPPLRPLLRPAPLIKISSVLAFVFSSFVFLVRDREDHVGHEIQSHTEGQTPEFQLLLRSIHCPPMMMMTPLLRDTLPARLDIFRMPLVKFRRALARRLDHNCGELHAPYEQPHHDPQQSRVLGRQARRGVDGDGRPRAGIRFGFGARMRTTGLGLGGDEGSEGRPVQAGCGDGVSGGGARCDLEEDEGGEDHEEAFAEGRGNFAVVE